VQITISKRAALIIAVAMLLVIPLAANAGSVFEDVDDTSTHIDGITFMKTSGVSVGCDANNNYCPGDNVTRAQMATFMYRLSGNDPATDPSVVAASAESADDADALGGAGPSAYTTLVNGDVCDAASCLDLTGATIEIVSTLAVETPTDGFAQVSFAYTGTSSPAGTNVVQVWVTYNDATCSWFFAPTDAVPGGYVHALQDSDDDLITVSGSTTLALPAGTHTLRLCALSLTDDMTSSGAAINTVWSANGSGASLSGIGSLAGLDAISELTGS
jgi:hypothetical protein